LFVLGVAGCCSPLQKKNSQEPCLCKHCILPLQVRVARSLWDALCGWAACRAADHYVLYSLGGGTSARGVEAGSLSTNFVMRPCEIAG
jgi:hypothetical protein